MKIGDNRFINPKFVVEMSKQKVTLEPKKPIKDFMEYTVGIEYKEGGFVSTEEVEEVKAIEDEAFFIVEAGMPYPIRYCKSQMEENEWNDLEKLFRILGGGIYD